jgi:hypothetical protein
MGRGDKGLKPFAVGIGLIFHQSGNCHPLSAKKLKQISSSNTTNATKINIWNWRRANANTVLGHLGINRFSV